jgi:hypothetical protein
LRIGGYNLSDELGVLRKSRSLVVGVAIGRRVNQRLQARDPFEKRRVGRYMVGSRFVASGSQCSQANDLLEACRFIIRLNG